MEHLQAKRIDRIDLLNSPEFWAIHFRVQTEGRFLVEDFFDCNSTNLKTFWRKEFGDSVLDEPDKYPCYCFIVPTPGGYSVSVEYRCYPEDYGLDYYIHHPLWAEPLFVGSQEGTSRFLHSAGRKLSVLPMLFRRITLISAGQHCPCYSLVCG